MFSDVSGKKCDVEALAAEWAVRSAEGTLDVGERRELDAWLASDARHLGAFVRAQAIWADVDRLAALRTGARVESPRPHGRQWFRAAIAASMVLFVASAFLAYDRLDGRIATERAEVRRVTLEDGSTVSINGNSVLQVRFDADRRHVVLRRGEASFQVAHNSERPFVVTADDVTVTAVGTEFVVGLTGKDVAVTVAEGVVKLQRHNTFDEQQEQFLRHDEQYVAAPTGPRRVQLDPEEVNRRLAWRDGLLVFEGQPLGVAAEEVNRHSDKPVVIDDPTLARAEFIGVFHIGDSQSFANAAAFAFNGKVVEREDAYHLMRTQNSPSH